jgi:hypothetical protein
VRRALKPEEFEATAFGTATFLAESSSYLSPQQLEQVNRWLLSEKYRRILQDISRRIY